MGDTKGFVLVVEDDPHIRDLICEALRTEQLECAEAADGEAAVMAARERRPDLVILDLGLPGMDGVAVADHIQDTYDPAPPVIVVTAGLGTSDASRIRPIAYITKPFDVNDLVSAVTQAIAPPAGAAEGGLRQPAES